MEFYKNSEKLEGYIYVGMNIYLPISSNLIVSSNFWKF